VTPLNTAISANFGRVEPYILLTFSYNLCYFLFVLWVL